MRLSNRVFKSKEAQKAVAAGAIEWQMWANSLGVLAGFALVVGGVVVVTMNCDTTIHDCANNEPSSWVGYIGLIIGLLVFTIEYPRSKRKRGRTIPRACQHVITPCISAIAKKSCIGNLYFRFLMYIALAIPTFFELPCILGGAILVICAIVYLVAALKGEAWVELAPPRERKKAAGTVIAAPTRAPPRLASVSKVRKTELEADYPDHPWEADEQASVSLKIVNE